MTAQPLLHLEDVTIKAGKNTVCRNVDLTINSGEIHILIGPNGSGKSSLLCGLMGIRPFEITKGTALFRGKNLIPMPTDERAHEGIGLAFQRPPSLTGVTADHLIQAIRSNRTTSAPKTNALEKLDITHLADRDINIGFSGGETKRWEIAKLTEQSPRLCLFDEPESGVDVEQVKVVAESIAQLLQDPLPDGSKRAAVIITHTGFILDRLDATAAHLLIDGRIAASGDATTLFNRVKSHGYAAAAQA
ncbi:MAG: ATP-binding cassette domain-containing protein [Corynebacterium sp.]|nr:ATP-binding cassette domain-containing protein [Corynebacterium sp.]